MHLFDKTNPPALGPALLLLLTTLGLAVPSLAAEPRVALARQGQMAPALRTAHILGHLESKTTLPLALTLPLRNQAQLDDLLHRLYTPGDPQQGKFLTPAQFTEKFGPTQQDYDAVAAYAKSQGLTVTATHSGRTILEVAGTTPTVEKAFGVTLGRYQLADGRVVFANAAAPRVPQSIAARLAGVAGLTNMGQMRPKLRLQPRQAGPLLPVTGVGGGIGTGPAGGLAPNDIKFAYNLSDITPLYPFTTTTIGTTTTGTTGTGTTGTGTTGTGTTTTTTTSTVSTGTVTGTPTGLDGAGQTLGLFELDGYDPKDVALYVSTFGLPTQLVPVTTTTGTTTTTTQPVLQNIVLGRATGGIITPSGQGEVTLDIDMALALAPNIKTIYVYEGNQRTDPTIAAIMFNRMADDTGADGLPLLKVISNSWGITEKEEDPIIRTAESTAFQKMAAQGQSIFTASGDSAAYDGFNPLNPVPFTQPAVDDPASQPFVTGVGGTTLGYNKPTSAAGTRPAANGAYVSETVWSSGAQDSPGGPTGSGGGSSEIWAKPDYQQGLGAAPFQRDVPDVALDADPNTGYDIFVAGQVETAGGTSAAAPLWAAFAALVNQQRALNGLGTTLGFANPILYSLARGSNYSATFHDVTTGTNLFYPALPGYDDATGLGSFIGDTLLTVLSFNPDQGTQTATVTGLVTDANGVPVTNATVSAVSAATGVVKATAVTDAGGSYTLTVPGALTLTITVDTSTVTLTPDANGNTFPFAGQTQPGVTVPAGQTLTLPTFTLAVAQTFPAGLQMISAPYDFSTVGDFAAIFGLAKPLTNPNPRLIQWQPNLSSYVFYPTAPADTLRLGQAYWIKFPVANYLHRAGVPAPTNQAFRLALKAGWNQISDPFLASAPLTTITVDALNNSAPAPLASSPVVQATLYRYDTGSGKYVALFPTTDTLDPYNGYWIYATQAAALIIPPVAPLAPIPIGVTPPGAPTGP